MFVYDFIGYDRIGNRCNNFRSAASHVFPTEGPLPIVPQMERNFLTDPGCYENKSQLKQVWNMAHGRLKGRWKWEANKIGRLNHDVSTCFQWSFISFGNPWLAGWLVSFPMTRTCWSHQQCWAWDFCTSRWDETPQKHRPLWQVEGLGSSFC